MARGVQPLTVLEIVSDFHLGPREFKAIGRLYRLIRRERPAIVETHTAKASFVGRLAARRDADGGRAEVQERFNRRRLIADLERLYLGLLAEKGREGEAG